MAAAEPLLPSCPEPVCGREECRYWLERAERCALLEASRGEHTLDEVGALLGVTRERVRQIEKRALTRIQALVDRGDPGALALLDHADGDSDAVRRGIAERRAEAFAGALFRAIEGGRDEDRDDRDARHPRSSAPTLRRSRHDHPHEAPHPERAPARGG